MDRHIPPSQGPSTSTVSVSQLNKSTELLRKLGNQVRATTPQPQQPPKK